MTGKTTACVHSPQQMKAQRWQALAQDRAALCGISVYAQIFIGLALYLYGHVSTPGYLSVLLMVPFALLLVYLARKTAAPAEEEAGVISFAAGKRMEKPVLFLFLLLHLFNAQLTFAALCAMLLDAMPEHSLWKMALLIAPVLAWANSGRTEDALARLARFLKWVIFALLLYSMLAAVPCGKAAHFFPLLGYGWNTVGQGALWMCGAVSGCVWPLLTPQNSQALSPLLKKKSAVMVPVLLAILAGCLTMLVSVWLMPVYAMARDETLGWRLMLAVNMTPSIPAWSMQTIGLLLLFFLCLSHSANQASSLAAQMAGKRAASGWVTTLLLLALVPCAVAQSPRIQDTLIQLAFLRGPVTLALVFLLSVGSAVHRRKRKEPTK